jgi:hypothetical protein
MAKDDVPYTSQALREDLRRVRNDWDDCQAKRDRDAIYSYFNCRFQFGCLVGCRKLCPGAGPQGSAVTLS